jgi:hypothetical protein
LDSHQPIIFDLPFNLQILIKLEDTPPVASASVTTEGVSLQPFTDSWQKKKTFIESWVPYASFIAGGSTEKGADIMCCQITTRTCAVAIY